MNIELTVLRVECTKILEDQEIKDPTVKYDETRSEN